MGHPTLVVQPASGVIYKVVGLDRRRQLGQKALMAAQRPVGVADDVVGHGQEPGQDGVGVQSNFLPAPPRLKEDGAGEFLGPRPGGGAAETVEIYRVGVSLEQFAKGGTVLVGSL